MNEKNIGINETFPVWWYIAWRAGLTMFIINFGLGFLAISIGLSEPVAEIVRWVGIIIGIIVSVYFMSKAINRDYKGFRLSAVSRG